MPIFNPLYQTVKDKGNSDYIEKEGPIPGKNNPWMGKGYYFWDGLYTRAEWWGQTHCHNKYMICECSAKISDDRYLDLAGNIKDLLLFKKLFNAVNELHDGKVKTISFVIMKLIKDNNFPYDAVRALSENCGGDEKIQFNECNQHSFLNLSPPMQVCIYNKSFVKNYHIIYPSEYAMDGYV